MWPICAHFSKILPLMFESQIESDNESIVVTCISDTHSRHARLEA